jgi:hypothetical protein
VNLIGLFKHRQQNVWVKTEHSINVDMDEVLAAPKAEETENA